MIKRKSSILRFVLLAAVAAIVSTPLFGQAFYGSMVGTITDQSGGSVTGATVT